MRRFCRYYWKLIALAARGTLRFSNSYFWVIGALIVWAILWLLGFQMELPNNIPGGVMAAALFFLATWVVAFIVRVLFFSHFEISKSSEATIHSLKTALERSDGQIRELTSPQTSRL